MTADSTPVRVSAEVKVDCPRERAFAYIADVRTHPNWSIDDLRIEEADPGPVQVGWRCKTVGHSVVRGGAQPAEIEVTEIDPPSRFAFRAVSLGAPVFHNRFNLREEDGLTVIERVVEFDAPAATLDRMKAVGPELGRRRDEGLRLLKEQLEAEG